MKKLLLSTLVLIGSTGIATAQKSEANTKKAVVTSQDVKQASAAPAESATFSDAVLATADMAPQTAEEKAQIDKKKEAAAEKNAQPKAKFVNSDAKTSTRTDAEISEKKALQKAAENKKN